MRSPNQSDMSYNKFERAYAKINLNLNIINKGNDNYHNLDSDIIFANLYDTISIRSKNTKNNKIKLIINGAFKNKLDKNILGNLYQKRNPRLNTWALSPIFGFSKPAFET